MSPDSLHPTAEELYAYRDGELPPERRSLVEAHVIGCSQCSARLEAMSEAEGALRARPDDVDDAYFAGMTASVMKRIGAGAAPQAAREEPREDPSAVPPKAPSVERRRPEPSLEEAPRRSKAGSWLGIAGTVAAAAAVVVVVALLARHQGDWARAPRPGVLGGPESGAGAPQADRGGTEADRRANTERKDEAVENAPAPEAKRPAAQSVPAPMTAEGSAPESPTAAPEEANDLRQAREQTPQAVPSPLVKTQSAADAIGALGTASRAGAAPSGQDYQRIVREHGLPTTWDETVGREALLGAEAPLRALYMSGRAGSDSARIRLYLAEAERLTLASPSDSAGVDRILHHYWRAIRLAGDDATLSALARRRLVDFQRVVGERP